MEQNPRRTTKHKRKSIGFNIIVAVLILSIVTICIALITDLVQQNREQTASVSVKIDSEQVDPDVYLKSESKEADTFTSYMTYPYTKIESIDIPIKQFVTEQENKFYEEMETVIDMLGESFQAHFDIQTDVEKIAEQQYKLSITTEQLVEKDNEFKQLHSFIIDIEEEKIIQWDDVFQSNENNELYETIIDEFNNKKMTESINGEQLKEELENNQIPWLFDEKQILLYFNPGQINDNDEFLVEEIQLISIYPFINESYESMLLSEEMKREIAKIEEELQQEQEQNSNESEQPANSLGGKKYIALTFDDGPHGVVTDRVLNTLEQYNAKATFFMLGQNAKNMPELAKKVANKGHEIANHSISHVNLRAVSTERVHEEMVTSLDQIEQATGIRPSLFRPPYGNRNDIVDNKAQETNQKIILWSVDTRDWESLNANSVYESVKTYAKPGSIILMHDIHPTTADALPQIMEFLSNNDYEFVTVSELLPYVQGSGIGPYYGIQ